MEEKTEKLMTVYQSGGQDVKLNANIVRQMLVKGDKNKVTDQEIVNFISLCQFNKLNPFLGECYLLKFKENATMIVGKEAFFKRAESNENYDGLQAGIIIKRGTETMELEGSYMEKDDVLVGGWAKVFRKDKCYPFVSKVRFSEYNTGMSIWKEKPGTMIAKIAKVQALREAFPSSIQAMYTTEEQNIDEAKYVEVKEEEPSIDIPIPKTVSKPDTDLHTEPEILETPKTVIKEPPYEGKQTKYVDNQEECPF